MISHAFEAKGNNCVIYMCLMVLKQQKCVMFHGFNEKMRQVMYLICVLYFLCPARLGLMHIGVFILLLLSGERNFGRFKSE